MQLIVKMADITACTSFLSLRLFKLFKNIIFRYCYISLRLFKSLLVIYFKTEICRVVNSLMPSVPILVHLVQNFEFK